MWRSKQVCIGLLLLGLTCLSTMAKADSFEAERFRDDYVYTFDSTSVKMRLPLNFKVALTDWKKGEEKVWRFNESSPNGGGATIFYALFLNAEAPPEKKSEITVATYSEKNMFEYIDKYTKKRNIKPHLTELVYDEGKLIGFKILFGKTFDSLKCIGRGFKIVNGEVAIGTFLTVKTSSNDIAEYTSILQNMF